MLPVMDSNKDQGTRVRQSWFKPFPSSCLEKLINTLELRFVHLEIGENNASIMKLL